MTSADAASITESAEATPPQKRFTALVGVSLGNALEVFDWTAFAILAPFFASQVFRPGDPTAALLSTFLVFGAGFVIRPFGGVIFGWFADRYGRKASLMAAILCASIGMVMIACVPTYDVAGIWAGVILLAARLLQGLAHTGEVASAYTYIAEEAPDKSRGLWSSSIYVSLTGGILAASLVTAGLTYVLGRPTMEAWGWRIPFVIGSLCGLFLVYLRRNLTESRAFEAEIKQQQDPDVDPEHRQSLWSHRASAVRVFLIMGSLSSFYYAWAVAGPSWAISVVGLEPTHALLASAVALTVGMVALPLAGALSDRIGRRRNFFIFGIGVAVLAYPIDQLARQGAWQFGLAMAIALILYSFVGSILPALLSELFPTGIRALGVGLPYALSAVVFAGPTPYLQQWTASHGLANVFVVYLSGAAVLGALVMWKTPETKGTSLIN